MPSCMLQAKAGHMLMHLNRREDHYTRVVGAWLEMGEQFPYSYTKAKQWNGILVACLCTELGFLAACIVRMRFARILHLRCGLPKISANGDHHSVSIKDTL